MENSQELLARLEKNSRQQLQFTKLLCILCAAAVICSLLLMIVVSNTAAQLSDLAQPMQALAEQAERVMTDLGIVAKELAKADLGGMVTQVDSLAADSQAALAATMKKMETIDIETLNKAVKDLADIVEPLAKISNFWG